MSKKPDIIMMLAVLIGLGILVTELASASGSVEQERPVQMQSRY